MVGTDFHPGIKGIGPKTGLKLMKKHGTMEAVSEAKGFDLPEDLESVRGLFMDHPLGDSAPTATSRAVRRTCESSSRKGGDSQRRGSTEPSTAWLTLGGLGPRVSPRCSTSDQMTSKSFSSVSGMPSPSSSSSCSLGFRRCRGRTGRCFPSRRSAQTSPTDRRCRRPCRSCPRIRRCQIVSVCAELSVQLVNI